MVARMEGEAVDGSEYDEVRMNIALKPDLENYVNEQVRVGRYRSADEFLAAAIARMMR